MAGKHNRRTFFRWAGITVLTGGALLWNRMVGTEKNLASKKQVTIPFDATREYTFHDDFIIVNREGSLTVLSARCTHLGCTIRKVSNGQLMCPCHGSTFDTEGKPLKGPAFEPLQRPGYVIDDHSGQITVEI